MGAQAWVFGARVGCLMLTQIPQILLDLSDGGYHSPLGARPHLDGDNIMITNALRGRGMPRPYGRILSVGSPKLWQRLSIVAKISKNLRASA